MVVWKVQPFGKEKESSFFVYHMSHFLTKGRHTHASAEVMFQVLQVGCKVSVMYPYVHLGKSEHSHIEILTTSFTK